VLVKTPFQLEASVRPARLHATQSGPPQVSGSEWAVLDGKGQAATTCSPAVSGRMSKFNEGEKL
jgi:hypothetical protein